MPLTSIVEANTKGEKMEHQQAINAELQLQSQWGMPMLKLSTTEDLKMSLIHYSLALLFNSYSMHNWFASVIFMLCK